MMVHFRDSVEDLNPIELAPRPTGFSPSFL